MYNFSKRCWNRWLTVGQGSVSCNQSRSLKNSQVYGISYPCISGRNTKFTSGQHFHPNSSLKHPEVLGSDWLLRDRGFTHPPLASTQTALLRKLGLNSTIWKADLKYTLIHERNVREPEKTVLCENGPPVLSTVHADCAGNRAWRKPVGSVLQGSELVAPALTCLGGIWAPPLTSSRTSGKWLNPQCLSFPICKIRIATVPTS